ncbi:PREDICTED: protein FAM187B-like [Nanorana parkeri]|uniref:protein FAM187B-like n=1 Tax=Nanorana parkeri TaxID=125878 RepID=UPI00085406A7|nr:PREDICTED: protein FAM187B-like [Nanorana parkeri]
MVPVGRNQENILQCPAHGPCYKAFMTSNPMSLKCGERPAETPITWQFLEARDPYIEAVTFISSSGPVNLTKGLSTGQHLAFSSLMSRAKLDSGDLEITSPRVEDTGVYICKDGEKTLASYEVDFQDASHIYISHASLMQNALLNTATDLGEDGTLQMFTVWSKWQPCDRCKSLGERRRIGYCYAEVSKDAIRLRGPLPCGLAWRTFKGVSVHRPPELQFEACWEDCRVKPSTDTEKVPIIVLDNYHTLLHADVSFTCPESTIYKPVYWMHGRKSITRLQQMLKKTLYTLDGPTGGGTLSIHMLNKTERGLFDCYVDRRLTERFTVIFPDIKGPPVPEHLHADRIADISGEDNGNAGTDTSSAVH